MKPFLLASLIVAAVVYGAAPLYAATPSIQITPVSSVTGNGKAPTCKTYFTYKKPRAGESTTLLWRSHRADYMTGLYTAEQRPSRGSQNIVFGHPGQQTFQLTFTGPGGSTTCTAKIMVRERETS